MTDSPIDYNRKISRQKTALTGTLKHTQAVSSADRVQWLALLVHTSTDSWYNSPQQVRSLEIRVQTHTHTNCWNQKKIMKRHTISRVWNSVLSTWGRLSCKNNIQAASIRCRHCYCCIAGLSACPSVGHDCEHCKKGWTDQNAVWDMDSLLRRDHIP